MRADTTSSTVTPPDPAAIPDTIFPPAGDHLGVEVPNTARAREAAAASSGAETGTERFHRKALRARLHGNAIVAVALVAVLILLAASNTAHVKVNWLIGTSQVSLVWLVLVTAVLGWVLGLVASARFHWLTRAPRQRSRARA